MLVHSERMVIENVISTMGIHEIVSAMGRVKNI